MSAESLFTDKVTYYESGVSEAAEPEPMPTIWNWTASRSRHLARLVRSPFLGQQDHERLDPTTKSDVPCAEVRESLSQLRVDGVPSAIQSVEQ